MCVSHVTRNPEEEPELECYHTDLHPQPAATRAPQSQHRNRNPSVSSPA